MFAADSLFPYHGLIMARYYAHYDALEAAALRVNNICTYFIISCQEYMI